MPSFKTVYNGVDVSESLQHYMQTKFFLNHKIVTQVYLIECAYILYKYK